MNGTGSDNGWLEAAIAWEVCASLHRQYCKGKDALFTTRQSDFVKHAENARGRASHGQAPTGESLRTDALCDLSYSHGLKAGWNYCASDDLAGFERAQKIGAEALRTLKSPTPQAADSVPAPPPPPECETEAEKRAFAFGWFKALESERMKADSVQEDAADPLQGAANWLAEAHGQFSPVVLSGCLMIGYNRAKRLHDAALAARKQGEKQ